ncbi:MAG: hypothetical protein KF729_16285 [Sandaracinaceae bacterium]|nr:hypothetical protein [Sandaracinaceae bacterium]
MKTWLIRAAVLAGTLVLGAALHAALAPRNLAWVVYALGGGVVALVALEVGLRLSRRRRERADWARWRAALLDPPARRRAIGELRRAADRAARLGPRLAVRQARLAVALGELQLAEGRAEDALRALARVDVSLLDPLQATIVRVARLQAYLHHDDLDGASSTLAPLDGAQDLDPVLDATLALARGAVALEQGRTDDALAAARAVASRAEPHDEIWDEARALEAASLEASGAPWRAVLASVEGSGRARLAALGSARVRRLCAELEA